MVTKVKQAGTRNWTSTIRRLAGQIQQDIQMRGLREGSRYVSTSELARTFGVSVATAHRATRLLAEQNWLVRYSNSHTRVGAAAGSAETLQTRTIYFFFTPEQKEYAFLRVGPTIKGLMRVLPEVNVQCAMLPLHNGPEFVEHLLSEGRKVGMVFGVLAQSCPVVYQCLATSGVPTVVSGTLPLGGPKLPSIDSDHRTAGRLLTDYLIGRGHRRLALISHTLDRPGDRLFFHGISESLTVAEYPHNALLFQVVPHDLTAIVAALKHFREEDPAPTGLIVRHKDLIPLIEAAALQLDLLIPHDLEIVFSDYKDPDVERSPYTHVQTTISREEATVLVAELFKRSANGESLENERIVVPVELREMTRGAN